MQSRKIYWKTGTVFSKTDPDATFMHMKYDYYNHTNVFKPGYNVQIGVNNGYIAYQYLSSDPNDIKKRYNHLQKDIKNYMENTLI